MGGIEKSLCGGRARDCNRKPKIITSNLTNFKQLSFSRLFVLFIYRIIFG